MNDVYLREPQPGELGWIVQAHGEFYFREFGWGTQFEGVVADIVGRYAEQMADPQQFCWIADLGGKPVGCVMLTRDPDRTARLRVMLVDEAARGRGVGQLLCQAVLDAAKTCGDRSVVLWTTSRQKAARRLYQRFGFQCLSSEPNTTFDSSAMDESWRLDF